MLHYLAMPKTMSPKKTTKRKVPWLNAENSDRHELYEKSVQEPQAECNLIDQVWSEQRNRKCRSIREDFCGTAAVCMEWVKRRKRNTAVGVDLDAEVLDWGRGRMPKRLNADQRKRIRLIQDNVLKVETEPVDSILAMNFSYFIFQKREQMVAYFKRVYDALADDGLLLLDAYGGSESFTEMEEPRDMDGFTYIWDQHSYNPVTGAVVNYIHFEFPDGSEWRKAFTYKWRLWTLPEIRELLREAGFKKIAVYWEGTDEETEEGNGEWSVTTRGEACEGWVAYLAGIK